MGYKKFSKLENEDGVELQFPEEDVVDASDVYWDALQTLRDKINSLGLGGYNFSFGHILSSEIITIPARQQMRVYQECRIDGELVCYGEAIVKDN